MVLNNLSLFAVINYYGSSKYTQNKKNNERSIFSRHGPNFLNSNDWFIKSQRLVH
jgi:hypothetical protein